MNPTIFSPVGIFGIFVAVDVATRPHEARTAGVVHVRRSSPVGIVDTDGAAVVVVDVTRRPHVPRIAIVARVRRS